MYEEHQLLLSGKIRRKENGGIRIKSNLKNACHDISRIIFTVRKSSITRMFNSSKYQGVSSTDHGLNLIAIMILAMISRKIKKGK